MCNQRQFNPQNCHQAQQFERVEGFELDWMLCKTHRRTRFCICNCFYIWVSPGRFQESESFQWPMFGDKVLIYRIVSPPLAHFSMQVFMMLISKQYFPELQEIGDVFPHLSSIIDEKPPRKFSLIIKSCPYIKVFVILYQYSSIHNEL